MDDIYEGILDGSEDWDTAFHWLDKLMDKIEAIGTMPLGYPKRPKIRPGLRVCPYGRYNIYYLVEGTGGVLIVRVLHASRDPCPIMDS